MNEFTVGAVKPVECFKEGWNLIRDEYWLIFAMTLVAMLISGAVPVILLGPIYCGVYYALLRKIDTGKAEFSDIFKGFERFGAGLVVALIMIVPVFAGLILLYISLFAAIFGSAAVSGSGGEIFAGVAMVFVFLEALVVSIVVTCIHAFITFAFPLIMDRGLGGLDAFKLSARAVWANLGAVVALILVQFVLALASLFICFIGVYLAMPIMFAGVTVAFRRIFPKPGAHPVYTKPAGV